MTTTTKALVMGKCDARGVRRGAARGGDGEQEHHRHRRGSREVDVQLDVREGVSRAVLQHRDSGSEHGGDRERAREQREDPVHLELRGVHPVQGLRPAAHGRGVSEAQREGRGLARRHLDRRGWCVAAERGGCRARVRAARDSSSASRATSTRCARRCARRRSTTGRCICDSAGRRRTSCTRRTCTSSSGTRSRCAMDMTLTIVANGLLVAQALMAADTLAKKGIEARVIDMHTIKPLDTRGARARESRDGRVRGGGGAHASRRVGERGGAGARGGNAGAGGVREPRRSLRGEREAGRSAREVRDDGEEHRRARRSECSRAR